MYVGSLSAVNGRCLASFTVGA